MNTTSLAPIATLPTSGEADLARQLALMQGQVAPAPYIDRYQQLFGAQGLTPQAVSQVMNLANSGYLWLLADLLDDAREFDTHLQSVVSKREQMVAGAEWDLLPENPKSADEAYIAAWTKRELQSIRSFQNSLSHFAGATYNARAVCEHIWVSVNGRLRLVDIIPLHPRRFAYASTSDWRLYLWDQVGNDRQPRTGMFPGIPLDAFPYGKFSWHLPRIRGGYPQREGLGRTLVWYSMMKRWVWRDWMALAEWAGRGLRVGTFATGLKDGTKDKRANPEHKAILEKMLLSFSSSSPAVIADTTSLQVLQLAHENKIHATLIEMLDAQMSKATLGGTLTTDAGNKGARSLGDTQHDDQVMLAVSDERQLSASVRYGIVAPIVRYQFGPHAPIPIFRLAVAPEASMLDHAQVIKTLVESGVEITQAQVYEQFRIRAPNPGQRILVPKKVTVRDEDPSDDETAGPAAAGPNAAEAPADQAA
ncbi:MAG TPA: DUF935 family protein [Kofleriaceae bacterium]|nr:DUF935 family protein [Kofleriaceae bacterium]